MAVPNTLAINVTDMEFGNQRRTVYVPENASISTLKQQIVDTSAGRWKRTDTFKLTFSNTPVVDAFGTTLESMGMADGCECESNSAGTFQINGYDMSRFPNEVPVNEDVEIKPKEPDNMYQVNINDWSVMPPLPYGLKLDSKNGDITGTTSVKGEFSVRFALSPDIMCRRSMARYYHRVLQGAKHPNDPTRVTLRT